MLVVDPETAPGHFHIRDDSSRFRQGFGLVKMLKRLFCLVIHEVRVSSREHLRSATTRSIASSLSTVPFSQEKPVIVRAIEPSGRSASTKVRRQLFGQK